MLSKRVTSTLTAVSFEFHVKVVLLEDGARSIWGLIYEGEPVVQILH